MWMIDFNPFLMIRKLFSHKNLISQFTKREIISRYKGSYLGVLWSFVTPLLMLLIYTFVFSEIFKSKWSPSSDSKLEFAFLVFCGLIIFNIFAEVITRAPSVVISNPNYVKKVIFPLEILPVVILLSSLFQSFISFMILLIGLYLYLGTLHWTVVLLPLVLVPIILLTIGLGWILASLGVFFRDIGQIIGLVVQATMLLSPIFYPISLIPSEFKLIYNLNPLTYVVEDTRRILVWGQLPQWGFLGVSFLIGALFFVIGYAWFQKTKGGFADVI
jgi:lipopolysaccharide transport system permease protein